MLSIIAGSKSEELHQKLLTQVELGINTRLSNTNLVIVKDNDQNSIHLLENIHSDAYTKEIIAEVITNFIVDFYEIKLISRILNSAKFNFISSSAKKMILNRITTYVSAKDIKSDLFNEERNKLLIKKKLIEYINESNKLSIEGFVNFRLNEYRQELENYIHMTLEEIFLEEQNREFVNFLRYFVSAQQPVESLVHVVRLGRREYRLFNILEEDITEKYFEDMCSNHIIENADLDDMLISALINICPVRIIFHELDYPNIEHSKVNDQSDQIVDLIFQIFDNRLLICHQCSFCTKLREELNLDDF